ncbi:hypothetical protein KCP71_20310 [Salmonella enterica subsp. enterica]|nr:hypothetical protein KCP71_20310 [Salmonella enterica subsp. enterica]
MTHDIKCGASCAILSVVLRRRHCVTRVCPLRRQNRSAGGFDCGRCCASARRSR